MFQMSIQMIDILDLGEILMICGFDARMTLSKIWLFYYIFNVVWCEMLIRIVMEEVKNAYNF